MLPYAPLSLSTSREQPVAGKQEFEIWVHIIVTSLSSGQANKSHPQHLEVPRFLICFVWLSDLTNAANEL